jgi:eukaryotic-like serine/threonine-protein kinase
MNPELTNGIEFVNGLSADHAAQVLQILEGYMAGLERGVPIPAEELVAQHPDLAGPLRSYLTMLGALDQAARNFNFSGPEAALAPPASAVSPAAPPLHLGDFEILREVGRGGMGVVYEARQLSLDRRVALKVLPFLSAIDAKQLPRFRNEAHAAAQLHHPHIVPVYSVGCERGVHYYAMQFIEGQTLAEVIRDLRPQGRPADKEAGEEIDSAQTTGPPPGSATSWMPDIPEDQGPPGGLSPLLFPRRPTPEPFALKKQLPPSLSASSTSSSEFFRTAAELGIQAAEALAHAHELGILHRDIKPSNLLIDDRGVLWVTDFGLARLPNETNLTRTGDQLGTLRYMSPEQTLGRPLAVDQRTDIYSLGVTLYELVTLRPAFDGRDRQALLRQIAQHAPTPPRRFDPAIPRDLETIILKATAPEPERRYLTAQDLADDLKRFLKDQPIRARRATLVERAARWTRRHRAVVITGLAGSMLAMTTGALLLWRAERATRASYLALQQARERETRFLWTTFSAMDQLFFTLLGRPAAAQLLQDREGTIVYGQAIDLYDKVAQLSRTRPDMLPLSALAERRSAFFHRMLNDRQTDASYRRAIASFEALVAASPTPGGRRELAELLFEFGSLNLWYTSRQEGERLLRRAIEIERDLVDDFAKSPSILGNFSFHRTRFAELLVVAGRAVEAGPLVREALDLAARTADPTLLNLLASLLVSHPEGPPHDPLEAVALARRAVALAPNSAVIRTTLALACYRAGALAEAVEAVEASMRLSQGGNAKDWFLLAMVRWPEGKREEARRCYERGRAWLEEHREWRTEDALVLQAEAEAVLGLPARGPHR